MSGKRVGCLVSGGNVDINVVAQVIELGLIDSGRRVKMILEVPNSPKDLGDLMNIITSNQAIVYVDVDMLILCDLHLY